VHCALVSATASGHHLRSAASHQFVVPSYCLSSFFLCRRVDDMELTAETYACLFHHRL